MMSEAPTDNGRFGVMAAVVPQTILCGNERLYPAGSSVEAATTPSRWDVVRHSDRTVRNWQRDRVKNRNLILKRKTDDTEQKF